ncbi:hypothetical protein R3P38DRAFT_415020 [Favolaschia claudopus]|uniref:TPX2 C-terminal domain-containing protein n=1 Tax=Favolaschia claudopus TaxID=2862362 RepID=A0AAV9ZGV2_9AGAR
MPGSDLSLRHLPDLSDVSFSFQIPADSGDDLLHGDSADFFGGATSMMVSPVAPRSVVDAPPTLGDPQATSVVPVPMLAAGARSTAKFLLPTTRSNIQTPSATQMASRMLKAIPASEMNRGPFHGAATPRVGASIDSESNDTQESTPRSKACNDTSKAKSHPMNLSPDELFSHLPNDSPIDGVSSKDAERVSADPSAEEKNSSLPELAKTARLPPPKSKKTATIPNQKSSTTTTSNPVRPKPTSTFATTKPRGNPVPAKTAHTNVEPQPGKQDVEPDSGIAGRLLMYGAQMITSFPQSDNDEDRTLLHNSPGSAAEEDVAMTDNIQPAGPEVVEAISPSDIFPHRSGPSPAHNRMEVADSKPRVSVVLDSEAGMVDSSVPQTDPLMSNSRDDPLTLSQLSPRKIAQPVQESGDIGGDSGKRAVSPMRPAVKRLSSAAPAEDNEVRRKKRVVGVGIPSAAAIPARPSTHTVRGRGGVRTVSAPAHVRTQPARKSSDALGKPVRVIQRTASSASSTSTLPRNAVVSAAPKIKKLPGISSASSSSAANSTSATRKVPTPGESSTSSTGSTRDAVTRHRREHAEESTESQQPRSKPYKIPDFKSMHASLAAQGALRRSQMAPTVPVPLAFSTDIRARERELFDEKVREKERELEAARELQRREREEEQVKEIREMRRRAVPKAHEVPDWYKEAPKKNPEPGQ